MVFKHKTTGRPALYIQTENPKNEAIIIVKEPADLPNIDWCKHFNLPPEIVGRGNIALLSYLKAFDGNPDILYLWFFPSGFPDGRLPQALVENKIAPRNKPVDGCVHTRPILISTQPTHFVPNCQPYNDSNDYITIEPFDTYDVWLSGQYCLECGTLLNIEIDD